MVFIRTENTRESGTVRSLYGRRMSRLMRSAGAVLLCVCVACTAAACSSDDEEATNGPTTPASILPPKSVTSIPSGSSTTTRPATTSTTAAPPVGAPDAATAAQTLYDAWVANDKVTASRVAEQAAIDAVWAAVPGPYQLYRGCDTGEFETGGCLFRDRTTNHTIQVDLTKRDGMWVVTGAFYSES